MVSIFRAGFCTALLFLSTQSWASDVLPEEIDIRDMGAGHLYVNQDGLTLYTFKQDREQPGTSTCIEECVEAWPPVYAPGDAAPVGVWTTVTRDDGSAQWAHKGRPVYTFVKDTHPGAIIGQTAGGYYRPGFWDVLYEPMPMPPDISLQASVLGQILADLDGRAIYAEISGACEEDCMKPWRPVEAPWLARPIGESWTVVEHRDGLAQWAYEGRPLYTYDGDFRTGDTNGTDAAGSWQVVVLQEAPAIPSWITFQETDIGPVMANQDRMTLYYQMNDPEQIRRETCDDQCVKDNWFPVILRENEQPVGNWSSMMTADGERQWTYLGYPVYVFRHDKMPGDTYGDKFGTGSEIRGAWNAILKETLVQKLASF